MHKILVLGMSSTLGGVETYIYNLIRNLDKSEYIFDFLVIGTEKSVFQDEINEFIGDGREHFYYAPNLKKNYFKAKKWLTTFYENHQYDIIYMNTCTAARIKYCEYPIKKFNTLLVSHSHSGNAGSKLHKISNGLYRNKLTKLSSVKLACSELAYKWLYTDEKGEKAIVPNGVDVKRFSFNLTWRKKVRNDIGVRDEEILIGNVGRFSLPKNQEFFLKLCKKLSDKYKILIIGDGELKEEIISKIKKENLEKQFIILPTKSDIEKYYSAMDIFVMPSIFEGLPIVAIEAQAEGLPCILSNNISKQTSLSQNCIFLELKNIDEWKEAIEKFSQIRYNGTAIVEEKGFDSLQPVRMIERVFREINGKEN